MENKRINISQLPYYGTNGIDRLAERLDGTERLHMGLRPYGLHAGNELVLFCYPYLLAKRMRELGREPRFDILISLNDWEPQALHHTDGPELPYNIASRKPTFQFQPAANGLYVCDALQTQLESLIAERFRSFPNLRFSLIRNSQLKYEKEFSRVLQYTLLHPAKIGQCIRPAVASPIDVRDDMQFAGAVCPSCLHTNGRTKITEVADGFSVRFCCNHCDAHTERDWLAFDYWMHFLPLRLARLATLGFGLHITGADHLMNRDIYTIHSLKKLMCIEAAEPLVLVAPLLLDAAGEKLAKSNGGSSVRLPFDQLLHLAAHAQDSIIVPDSYAV